jgi:hypothetical protein
MLGRGCRIRYLDPTMDDRSRRKMIHDVQARSGVVTVIGRDID